MLDPAAGTHIEDTRDDEAPEWCACGALLDDGECPRGCDAIPYDMGACVVVARIGEPPLPQWQPKAPAGSGATLESWGGWTADMDAEGNTVATSRNGGSASGVVSSFVAKAWVTEDGVIVRLHHPEGIVSCEVPWEVLGAMVLAMDPGDRAEVLRQMGCPPEGLAALP
jgi:hypothetical protein